MEKLPSKHLKGIEFFRFPGLKTRNPNDYFNCLDTIRSLLRDSKYKKSTPGFYINQITNKDDDGFNSLRLTYFTINPMKTLKAINKFVKKNNKKIAIFNSKWSDRPDKNKPLQEIEDKELRFRNFLNNNTRIFLEVVQEYGIEPLAKLIYKYRYESLPQRIPPEDILGPVFARSKYFQRLQDASLDKQYWKDLVSRLTADNFGLHFLVNISCVIERWNYEPFFGDDWIIREKE